MERNVTIFFRKKTTIEAQNCGRIMFPEETLNFSIILSRVQREKPFLNVLQVTYEKKKKPKRFLRPSSFVSLKNFFPPASFEPPTKTGTKETVPKKMLKMVFVHAPEKPLFVWEKNFFFTLMNKVRLSFSVFCFFLPNSCI